MKRAHGREERERTWEGSRHRHRQPLDWYTKQWAPTRGRERESSCLGYMLLLGPYQTLKANRAGSQPKADPEDSTGRKKKARDGKKKRKTKYSRHPYSQQRRCLADTWDNVYKMRLPLLLLSINFPSIQKEPPSLPWKVNITKARRGT